jgi:hypothetical protein
MEAWPEEPELVDETEMRGRWVWAKGAEGGRKREASSVGLAKMHEAGAEDQATLKSSDCDSALMSGVGVVAVGVEAAEVVVAELEVDVADGDKSPVEGMDGACIGGGGGGH